MAIGDLPKLGNGERSPTDHLHFAPVHSAESLARFAATPKNGGSRQSLPPDLVLACHQSHNGHRDVYGRLRWDRPSGTITAGCTQPSKGRFLHPEQDRGLTLREAARLQGFPDSYRFFGTKQQIALQIGNAVPPPLALSLAQAICSTLWLALGSREHDCHPKGWFTPAAARARFAPLSTGALPSDGGLHRCP
jgi:DNA (cytosine-5)-methyltransferase 1